MRVKPRAPARRGARTPRGRPLNVLPRKDTHEHTNFRERYALNNGYRMRATVPLRPHAPFDERAPYRQGTDSVEADDARITCIKD